jgi:hypothetical protein
LSNELLHPLVVRTFPVDALTATTHPKFMVKLTDPGWKPIDNFLLFNDFERIIAAKTQAKRGNQMRKIEAP